MIYLNDILIYFDLELEYINYIKQVLKRLRRFSLFISLKKYKFFTTKVKFLGFIVSITDISIDKRRIEII